MHASTKRRAVEPFTVVIVYEDYDCGIRAQELYRRLSAQWEGSLDFHVAMWRFEPLGVPSLREEAAAEAIQADLVLVSATGKHPLPAEVKQWIEIWRGAKGEFSALALLLDGRNHGATGAQEITEFLQAAAQDTGCSFFSSGPMPPRPLPFERAGISPVLPRMVETETLPAGPADHWGIND